MQSQSGRAGARPSTGREGVAAVPAPGYAHIATTRR